ncbi:hypothetical protein [Clostridium intestinale]|uniref:Uncharacterized protein n=1 Tax=Clostridium intestinale TaxID=36845 RepID=A0A7D6VSI1_9CLOT|nr:hypothetical protein [Clostridium intestinale]QLY77992.1 hypothetical protein HZF06_12860 [Clostridium intestinale]
MEKCYMLFNDEKIYIKSNKSINVAEYTINDAVSYPNVPLYFNIFNNEDLIKDMRTFIKDNEDINSLMQGIFAKKVYLLVPDDVTNVTDIEKRAFDEFAKKLLKGKEVIFGSEFAFVTTFEEKDYVCISRTCRMLILTSIKDKKIFKQKFIQDKEYTNDELRALINEVSDGNEYLPKVYLNGNNLCQYSDIGIHVDKLDIIKNFEDTLNQLNL